MRIGLVPLLFATSAFGQITTGTISGYIFDPARLPIQNAKVVVKDTARSTSRPALTDVNGFYRVTDLLPSSYQVQVAAMGFAAAQSAQLRLEVNATREVDFNLAVAGQEQSVTVRASASTIQTESSDVSTVIDQQRIDGLPLNERDFLQLALLTPGVTTPVEGSELSARGAFAMHANGAREEYNDFLLDGVDNNDQDTNRYILQPPVDAIQEFKIATNSYSAEYGRNAGAQVNVITRSGSNELHGFAYEYLRNRLIDSANSFDQGTKPELIRNQFGAGLGGPIRKNRTFYFVNFDALRGREGFSQGGTVPTVAERQGNFANTSITAKDPFTGQPFPGNTIPASRIDPLAARYLSLFPLPNASGAANFLGQPVERDANSQFSGRLDQRLGESGRLTLRYSYGRKNLFEPFTQNSTQIPGYGDYVYDTGHNAMAQYSRSFGARTENSLILGMNRASRDIYQQNYQTDVNKLWGLNYLPTLARDFGYPSVSVAGFSQVGDVTELPIVRAENTFQVSDTLSMVRGAHSIKVGADVRRIQQNGVLDIYSRGALSFSGNISGSGISDVLLGYPTFDIQSQANNPQAQRTTAVGTFVQDDWKVTRQLTLNLGLRYDYFSPPVDPHNHMSDLNLATGMLEQVGTNGISRSGIRPDYTNFAPRMGFAYSPTPDIVIRGGYGIYYDGGMLTVNSAMYFNPPYFNIYVFFPSATSLLTLSNPFPLNRGFVPPASLSMVDPNLTTSYMQSWNLNIQRDLHRIGTFSIGYAASKGTHLIRSLDLNQPFPGPGPLSAREPYPAFSNIFFAESGADSEYQSLQVTFNRRLARGLSMLGTYTFSKSIDDTSAFLGTTGDKNFPQNSHDYHAEHGLSNFDTTNRMVMAFVYDLPFQSNRALRHWESAAIITAQSGQPFTPILEFDNSNTGNVGGTFGSDRPNVVGDPYLANPTAQEWFNTAAFAIAPPYHFGDAGRNILRGPGLATVDLSLTRRFVLNERVALAVIAQAFNLVNRENLNTPNNFADNPATFGQIFSAKAPRQVQLALRLAF